MGDLCISFTDVQTAFEGVIPDEQFDFVMGRTDEATRLLFAQCPRARLAARDGDDERIALVRDVIIRAVLRVVRNDDPMLKSESEGGYSYTKDALTASGNLWFPDADLAALGCGANSRSALGTATITPRSPYATPPRRTMCRGGWW